jgi:hypothetical protein
LGIFVLESGRSFQEPGCSRQRSAGRGGGATRRPAWMFTKATEIPGAGLFLVRGGAEGRPGVSGPGPERFSPRG